MSMAVGINDNEACSFAIVMANVSLKQNKRLGVMVYKDRRMTSRYAPAATTVTDAPPFKYNTAIAQCRTHARMHNPSLFKMYHIPTCRRCRLAAFRAMPIWGAKGCPIWKPALRVAIDIEQPPRCPALRSSDNHQHGCSCFMELPTRYRFI
ncbi:unnamed protein product, partial [Iphiclides podalirius]